MKSGYFFILRNFSLFVAIMFLAAGCGTNNPATNSSTGAIAAKLIWDANNSKTLGKIIAKAPAGVATVRVIVTGAGMANLQRDFPAADGQGVINEVPSGSGKILKVQGLDSSGQLIYQGEVSNITVQAGQTTAVGVISMQRLSTIDSITAPTITSFDFTPKSMDVSSAPVTVLVSLAATDPSGMDPWVQVDFVSPSGVTYSAYDAHYVSGTTSQAFTIPAGSAAGTYSISFVLVKDKIGNSKFYRSVDLAALGFPTTFQVTSSTQDVAPPTINSFDITPKSMDVSSAPATVLVSLAATDPSGMDPWVQVDFVSPSGVTYSAYDAHYISGTTSQAFTIPSRSAAGTYSITFVLVKDKIGNSKFYRSADLAALGFPTTFQVTSSTQDITPPSIASFDITPKSVDVSSAQATVSVSLAATDTSGLDPWVQVDFVSPSGVTYSAYDAHYVSGTTSQAFTIPAGSAAGTYSVSFVLVKDKIGNSKFYRSADLAALGFPTTFQVR